MANHDAIQLAELLAAPFPVAEVQFKPGVISGNRALALAYVDARTIMDRLDAVVGIDGWQDEFQCLPDGSVVCKLRLRIAGRWIRKMDVGSQSEQSDSGDRTKAAFSDALKRAAVKFGVGRYLYSLPGQWVDYDLRKKQLANLPALPTWALPKSQALTDAPEEPTTVERAELVQLLQSRGRTIEGLMKWLRLPHDTPMEQLTRAQLSAAMEKLHDSASKAA